MLHRLLHCETLSSVGSLSKKEVDDKLREKIIDWFILIFEMEHYHVN